MVDLIKTHSLRPRQKNQKASKIHQKSPTLKKGACFVFNSRKC
jgi:hypothetical protein